MDKTARLWDAAAGKALLVITDHEAARSLFISRHGRFIMTASVDDTARVQTLSRWVGNLQLHQRGDMLQIRSVHNAILVGVAWIAMMVALNVKLIRDGSIEPSDAGIIATLIVFGVAGFLALTIRSIDTVLMQPTRQFCSAVQFSCWSIGNNISRWRRRPGSRYLVLMPTTSITSTWS